MRDDPPAGTSRTRRPTAVRGEGSGPLFLSRRSDLMAWIYLVVAGLFEVAWAIGLKYTEGWTRLWPSLGTLAGMVVSFWFLSQALKAIPLGTGYAIWTGIGAIGVRSEEHTSALQSLMRSSYA